MGGFVNSVRKALLDHYFGKSTLTAPTIYVGLSSTTPTVAGENVTEPTEGGYARIQTAASDWNAATSADPAELTNANNITFSVATEAWAAGNDLTYGILFDAPTNGNVIGFGKLTIAKKFLEGDVAQISVGNLKVQLATVADV